MTDNKENKPYIQPNLLDVPYDDYRDPEEDSFENEERNDDYRDPEEDSFENEERKRKNAENVHKEREFYRGVRSLFENQNQRS